MSDEDICGICLNTKNSPAALKCGHTFCSNCIVRVIFTMAEWSKFCPLCRQPFFESIPEEIESENVNPTRNIIINEHRRSATLIAQDDEGAATITTEFLLVLNAKWQYVGNVFLRNDTGFRLILNFKRKQRGSFGIVGHGTNAVDGHT